jgi:DnaK suppressor protein
VVVVIPRDGPAAEAARQMLNVERDHTAARVAALTEDLDGIVESTQLVETDDEHDPEGVTIAYERAQTQALLKQADEHLAALDLALERVERGTYGVCESCGREVEEGRLEARPAATTCIACASRRP